jgi:hypothetical protein
MRSSAAELLTKPLLRESEVSDWISTPCRRPQISVDMLAGLK